MSGFFSPSTWKADPTQSTIPKCGACGLHKQCLSPRMEVTGKGKRKILFIAEAPGEEEDRQGVQLVGKSGQLLRRTLQGLGVDLDDCWKTNAVLCRPPENKMASEYVECCRATVWKTVKELNPHVIILLGKEAVESLIQPLWKKDMGSLKQWVGWNIPCAEHGAWVCPTYHPAYLLRNEDPVLELMFEKHLRAALDLEQEERNFTTTEQLQGEVEVIEKERLIRARLRDMKDWTGRMAFDYETTGLKPERKEQRIVSCSFCLEGEGPFAFPTSSDKVMKLLSRVLSSPGTQKIASNIKFEERWTLAKMGHGVANWFWDTMLAAHLLNNQTRTSVKFLAFVLLGIPDFSSHTHSYLRASFANDLNRILELDIKDLLIYNGMDSLLEYKVMERQRAVLGWK